MTVGHVKALDPMKQPTLQDYEFKNSKKLLEGETPAKTDEILLLEQEGFTVLPEVVVEDTAIRGRLYPKEMHPALKRLLP